MNVTRRFLLGAGALALAGAAMPSTVLRAAYAAAPLPEADHVWSGPEMGHAPFLVWQQLKNRSVSEDKIREKIDVMSDGALAHAINIPIDDRDAYRRQINYDRQQAHDELPRLWQQQDFLRDRKTPLPRFCNVKEIQQGEFFNLQYFRGGKPLRNVVADLRGLPRDLTNRQFILTGELMRLTIPGICGNCSLQIVPNQTEAICIPIKPGTPSFLRGLGAA